MACVVGLVNWDKFESILKGLVRFEVYKVCLQSRDFGYVYMRIKFWDVGFFQGLIRFFSGKIYTGLEILRSV